MQHAREATEEVVNRFRMDTATATTIFLREMVLAVVLPPLQFDLVPLSNKLLEPLIPSTPDQLVEFCDLKHVIIFLSFILAHHILFTRLLNYLLTFIIRCLRSFTPKKLKTVLTRYSMAAHLSSLLLLLLLLSLFFHLIIKTWSLSNPFLLLPLLLPPLLPLLLNLVNLLLKVHIICNNYFF